MRDKNLSIVSDKSSSALNDYPQMKYIYRACSILTFLHFPSLNKVIIINKVNIICIYP